MPEVRLIDANALLKKCIEGDGNDKFTEGYNFAVQEISAYITLAPTIEPEVRHGWWIPCSERLPEKSGEYLVYTEYEDVFKCYFEKENDPEEDECQWGFYQDYRDPDTLGWAGTTWTAVETVTHWMPLPEPPEKE